MVFVGENVRVETVSQFSEPQSAAQDEAIDDGSRDDKSANWSVSEQCRRRFNCSALLYFQYIGLHLFFGAGSREQWK